MTKKYFCFAIWINGKLYTESVQAGTFRRAVSLIPKAYKSWKKVEFLGKADRLSEAVMTCSAFQDENKISETPKAE